MDIFSLIYLFSILSPCPWETARYRLIYCLKEPFNQNQPTNQPMSYRNFAPYSNWHHSLKGSLGETSCVPVSGLLTVWMDALVAIYVFFNSISVTIGRWEGATCNKRRELQLRWKRITPSTKIELGPQNQKALLPIKF